MNLAHDRAHSPAVPEVRAKIISAGIADGLLKDAGWNLTDVVSVRLNTPIGTDRRPAMLHATGRDDQWWEVLHTT